MALNIYLEVSQIKILLIAFLNEIFKDRKTIIDLNFDKTELQGPNAHFRKSVFDLTCKGADGEKFVIEMQRIYQQFFMDRAIYYTSLLINEQAPKGNPKWDFKLKEIYFVGLLDFEMENNKSIDYISRASIINEETGKLFYEN